MYKDVYTAGEIEQRKAIWRVLVDDFFQKYINENEDTVLDIGCGWGEFINAVKARRKLGIDVSGEYRRFLERGSLYSLQSCCNTAFRNESVDVIFASNLFEHLPSRDDVMITLTECRRTLRHHGTLLILQPNFK